MLPRYADILADETVILEIKAVPTLLPVRNIQLQTYLRMSGFLVGLLFNFHAVRGRLAREPEWGGQPVISNDAGHSRGSNMNSKG
jgi:hypothetical protein